MEGYKGNTQVTVLREIGGKVQEQVIGIDQVTSNDFIKTLYPQSMSIQYLPANVAVGDYKGKMFKITFVDSDEELILSEGQKLFACEFMGDLRIPFIDEKNIQDFKDTLIASNGEGREMPENADSMTLSEYIEFYKDLRKTQWSFKKMEIKSIETIDYEGRLYNLVTPIEYALIVREGVVKTTMH